MKWISTITAIGPNAIDNKENIVILFGEQATEEIKDVAIIQKFDDKTPQNDFVMKKSDSITIDGQTYLVEYAGQLVQSNMRAISHVTLIFSNELPENPMQNAIYLHLEQGESMPNFTVDGEIYYEHN